MKEKHFRAKFLDGCILDFMVESSWKFVFKTSKLHAFRNEVLGRIFIVVDGREIPVRFVGHGKFENHIFPVEYLYTMEELNPL